MIPSFIKSIILDEEITDSLALSGIRIWILCLNQ